MELSDPNMLKQLRSTFGNTLRNFHTSQDTFRIIWSVPDLKTKDTKTLFVLDSSFNPPSKAHLLLAHNAIKHDAASKSTRILLLLATQNADKKPKPAANEDRLVMMALLASELYKSIGLDPPPVDVGVTKEPFFVDKARSIDESHDYGRVEQVHLTGYDTLVRIFDTKYYPKDKQLKVLEPFLDKHRLRVTYRLGDNYGTKEDQDAYVKTIADGSREAEGMKKEWRHRIDLVDDARDGTGVSSTEARNACVNGRYHDLGRYVCQEVAEYIKMMNLYEELGEENR